MKESIIVDCRKHWINFVTSAALIILLTWYGLNQIVISIQSRYSGAEYALIGAVSLALAVFVGVRAVISYRSNYLQITESWVIGKSSWFTTRLRVSPIDKVVNVAVSHGLLGSLLGYSNVVIYTAGSVFSSYTYRGVTNGDLLQEKFMDIKKAAGSRGAGYRSSGTASAAERRSEAAPRWTEPVMISCKNCGRSIEAGSRVCPYCGKDPTVAGHASAGGWKTPDKL